MRNSFLLLTAVLILVGFVAPIAWVGAVVTAVLAIAARPGGTRADGKPRSGGLLGGLVDSITISSRMRDCPFCRQKIMKDAKKCQHCHEWIGGENDPERRIYKYCSACSAKNRIEDSCCINCGGVI